MNYIGIDPGLTGAMGWLNGKGEFIDVLDLPTEPNGKASGKIKRRISANLLNSIIENIRLTYDDILLIEEVHGMPNQNSSTVFSLGDTFGVCRAIVELLDISHGLVSPNKWKKYFNIGKDKAKSLELARKLFPKAPLGRQKDHNRAEALLIARYAYENVEVLK